jgi:hypothetical protein
MCLKAKVKITLHKETTQYKTRNRDEQENTKTNNRMRIASSSSNKHTGEQIQLSDPCIGQHGSQNELVIREPKSMISLIMTAALCSLPGLVTCCCPSPKDSNPTVLLKKITRLLQKSPPLNNLNPVYSVRHYFVLISFFFSISSTFLPHSASRQDPS